MSWEPLDLASPEFAAPTEPPAVCGLIYRGRRHMISGPPEAAKTLAALIFGLEWMRSGEGTFALIDFEMGAHATRLLLNDLGATLEEIGRVVYVSPDCSPAPSDLDALTNAGVTLAIVDSAAGAYGTSGLDDNSRQDAETFGRLWITPLFERGVATIVLDHVVKNGEARGKFAIGSERKVGTTDVHLGFEPIRQLSRGGSGAVRVLTHKDRPAHLPRPRAAELHLESDPATHAISWTFTASGADRDTTDELPDRWRPTILMDRVLEHFSRNPEPISRSALANLVTGKREFVLQAIDELAADGRLTTQNRKVVPVPRNVPGTTSEEERSHVPLSTEGTTPGTLFGNDSKAAA